MKWSALYLTILSLPAFGMSFKAQIQPLKLPLSVGNGMPAPISNTKPGEMSVSMHRICGDGDVANFASAHPTFEIVPNTVADMKYVIGYWVVPAASSDSTPTASNFYTLGYGTMPIAANASEVTPSNKFIPMNYSSSAGFNGMELFGKESVELYEQAKRSMAANLGAPAAPVRIYGGVFTCMNMAQESAAIAASSINSGSFIPGHTEIGNYLGHQDALPKLAENASLTDKMRLDYSSSPAANTLYKVDYGAKALPFDVNFGSGPNLSGTIAAKYNLVRGLSYPAGLVDGYEPAGCDTAVPPVTPCNLVTKEQKYDNFISSAISSIAPGGSDADLCTRVGITVNGDYKWEFFKQNSACRHFLRNFYSPSTSYLSAYSAIFPGGVYPSSGTFNSARDQLARRLFVGAVLENAHERIQADSNIKTKATLARPHCFDNGSRPLIERIVGSYPIAMKLDSGSYKVQSNPFNHVHPEPLFALSDSTTYYSDNRWAVFGQVIQTNMAYAIPAGACIPTADGATYDPDMGVSYVDCSTGAPFTPAAAPAAAVTSATLDPTDWSFLIPHGNSTDMTNNKIDSNSIKADKIDIIFKIRSLGDVPNCPWFC